MIWTVDEHEEEILKLYSPNVVRDGASTVGARSFYYNENFDYFIEQLVVEDHPEYAWVWEEEQ